MTVESHTLTVQTKGDSQVINLTERVAACVHSSAIANGLATIFVVGSTAGVTTTEYEPGLVNHDLKAAFEAIAPIDGRYEHERTWNDDNGHAHVRASLLGPNLSVPFAGKKLLLGTWQQIVLIDFDTRERARSIVVQLMGDASD